MSHFAKKILQLHYNVIATKFILHKHLVASQINNKHFSFHGNVIGVNSPKTFTKIGKLIVEIARM